MELNKIYQGDCLQVLKTFSDKSVDLILTDPPYELENHGGGTSEMWRQLCDKHIDFISNGFDISVLAEFERVCKVVNIIMFCSNKQVSKLMSYFENKGYSTTLLVWHKPNAVPFGNGKYISDIEFIVFVRGKNATYNSLGVKEQSKLFQYNYPTKDRLHPTQKPVPLIERLIKLSSNEKDTILDPFIGSGTTAVACLKTGRNYVRIELDQKYVDIANNRINEFSAQGVLL
jgi:site-specific DNA-methyltransferase (adenine-specific)